MNKWFFSFKLHCKFLFANWFFVALPPLFGAWFAVKLSQIGPPVSQDLYLYVYDFHKIQHTLSLGVAMLIGIVLVRRDTDRPAYEWNASLPVSAATMTTAKYAAGLLYLTSFTAVMAAVFILFGVRRELMPGDIAAQTGFFALQYEVSYAVTLALSMFLALVIPNRISYLIAFCAWIFGTFFIDTFIISRYGLFFLKTFHLNQFFLYNSPYENGAWGYYISAGETRLSRLFVCAFAAMLLCVVIAVLNRRRPSGGAKRWTMLAILAVIGSAAAFAPYGLLWKERYEANAEKLKNAPWAPDYYGRADAGEIETFAVNSYDITVKRQKGDSLKVIALIRFPAPDVSGQAAVFTLNRTFHITRTVLDGEEIEAVRSGDFFRINKAHLDTRTEEHTLQVEYEGTVFDWNLGRNEAIAGFVRGEHLFLPSHLAWYPLPGEQHIYLRGDDDTEQNRQSGLRDRADFRVALEGFPGKVYATIRESGAENETRIFRQNDVEGVTLFGGRFIEVISPDERLSVVTTSSNRLEAEQFLREISKMNQYFASWIGEPSGNLRRIFYFPFHAMGNYNGRLGSYYGNYEQISGNSLVIGETLHHNLDEYQATDAVNALWFGDLEVGTTFSENAGDPRYSIVGEIRRAFYYLYYRDHLQMGDREITGSRNVIPALMGPWSDRGEEKAIFGMIDEAVADGKAERVKRVLLHFYRKGLTIRAADADAGRYEYPLLTMKDWQREWERVMHDE